MFGHLESFGFEFELVYTLDQTFTHPYQLKKYTVPYDANFQVTFEKGKIFILKRNQFLVFVFLLGSHSHYLS